MKKVLSLMPVLVFAFNVVMSQEMEKKGSTNEKFDVSIGFNGGISQNTNAYRLTADDHGFTYYEINPNYSIGLDIGVFVTNKIRTRFEFKYFEMDYGMNWNYDDSDFDKTITTLYNLDLNLYLDYSIFSGNKMQFFISAGIINEFVTGYQIKNVLSDGGVNYKNYNVLSKQYPEVISGGNISVLLKYKINDYIGISLSPGYTYFFRNFVRVNDEPYQRTNLNIGLEYTF